MHVQSSNDDDSTVTSQYRMTCWYLAPDEHGAEHNLKTVEEVVTDDDDSRSACRPTLARTDRFYRRSRCAQEP